DRSPKLPPPLTRVPLASMVRIHDPRAAGELAGAAHPMLDLYETHTRVKSGHPRLRAEVGLEDAAAEEGRDDADQVPGRCVRVEGLQEVRLVEAVHEAAEAVRALEVDLLEAAQIAGVDLPLAGERGAHLRARHLARGHREKNAGREDRIEK